MSLLRRLPVQALRNLKPRAGGGKFWADGVQTKPDGLLFGETPPPPGHSRHWESWELPWIATFAAATVVFAVVLPAKPDTSLVSWARKQAKVVLKEEGKL